MVRAKGEFYSGYKGGETPRFAIIEGRRIAVTEVIRRMRTLDPRTGKIKDVYGCRLADGQVIEIIEEL
ncbi:hypothetical protein D4R89_08510 [bacterium]|nr:MAG: hypothetical protein D4R89_08510 [bacterium]